MNIKTVIEEDTISSDEIKKIRNLDSCSTTKKEKVLDLINNNPIELVKLNGLLLRYINKNTNNYEKIVIEAIHQNPSSIDFVDRGIDKNYLDDIYITLEEKLTDIKNNTINSIINKNLNSSEIKKVNDVIVVDVKEPKEVCSVYETTRFIKECFNSFLNLSHYKEKYIIKIEEFYKNYKDDLMYLNPLIKKNGLSIDLKYELK